MIIGKQTIQLTNKSMLYPTICWINYHFVCGLLSKHFNYTPSHATLEFQLQNIETCIWDFLHNISCDLQLDENMWNLVWNGRITWILKFYALENGFLMRNIVAARMNKKDMKILKKNKIVIVSLKSWHFSLNKMCGF
jgi:hypothetical protein